MSTREAPVLAELGHGISAVGTLTVLRGVLAVAFGLIALANPGATAAALVIVFAVWAFVDGALAIAAAVRRGKDGRAWGWFAFEAFVSIAAGIVALAYPAITMLALVVVVAIRAIFLGILMIAYAIKGKDMPARWLRLVTGLVSIVFGIMLFWRPLVGAMALVWTLGIYAIVFGIMSVVHGVEVFGLRRILPGKPAEAR
ncbi:MAG TPA: HdeD family acid-resistance protein [Polyangiaceae bacterium]|nr:HdeD family acid-resistance protein [Polyangiaceae bacterium]